MDTRLVCKLLLEVVVGCTRGPRERWRLAIVSVSVSADAVVLLVFLAFFRAVIIANEHGLQTYSSQMSESAEQTESKRYRQDHRQTSGDENRVGLQQRATVSSQKQR